MIIKYLAGYNVTHGENKYFVIWSVCTMLLVKLRMKKCLAVKHMPLIAYIIAIHVHKIFF